LKLNVLQSWMFYIKEENDMNMYNKLIKDEKCTINLNKTYNFMHTTYIFLVDTFKPEVGGQHWITLNLYEMCVWSHDFVWL